MSTKPKLQVIFVAGLGDLHGTKGQAWAVRHWSRHGVVPQLFTPLWADKASYASKLQRLLETIDAAAAHGPVGLVGASAGAGLALNAFAQRKNMVVGVVCICGKFNFPESVGAQVIRTNPAFGESMAALDASYASLSSEDRQRILSVQPLLDESVPTREMVLPGARLRKVWSAGHAITIGIMITVRSGLAVRFLKRRATEV